jgi:O-antigen ligase
MPASSDSSGRHQPALDTAGRVVYLGTLLLVAWGVLAFGSPYPWAYTPLAVGSVVVGLAGWFGSHRTRVLPEQRRLLVALLLVAIGAAVQRVPLPAGVVQVLSPANARVLGNIDLTFMSHLEAVNFGSEAALPARPLSIDPSGTSIGLALLVAFGLLLAGLTRHCNRYGARRFAVWFVGFGAFVAIVGIVQKALLGDEAFTGMKIYGFWAPVQKLTTPFGPFVNKNHFAGWMLMALPAALGYLLAQGEMAFVRVRRGWRYRLLWLSSPEGGRLQIAAFAVVLMGASLMMTLSRSGVACFLLAMGAAAVALLRRQRSVGTRIAVVAAIGALLIVPILWANSNVTARFSKEDQSIQLRRGIWADCGRIMRDFPLTGTGLNTFASAMSVYQTGLTDQQVREAHNDYLQLASEGGLLMGVPCGLAMLALFVAIRRRFTIGDDDPATSWIRFGAATGIACIALQSLVEFTLQMPGNAVTFVVLCAIALHRANRPAPALNVVRP